MSNLKEDLDSAFKIISGYEEYDLFKSKIYPFSNEILTEILTHFDFNNKKCITVQGASDQALDMYLRGASSITTFDVNKFTKYYFYLKKAAVLAKIEPDEYIDFFYPYHFFDYINYNSFNLKTFDKIVPYLSGDNLIFWSNLFDSFESHYLSSMLLSEDIVPKEVLKNYIHYLKGDNYYELAEKIKDKDIDFKHVNVKDLENNINDKVDYIYLSNIMHYVRSIYSEIKLKSPKDTALLEAYKKLVLCLAKKLNNNGKIMVMTWNCFSICSDDYKVSEKVFNENCFNFKCTSKFKDGAILEYTKKHSA